MDYIRRTARNYLGQWRANEAIFYGFNSEPHYSVLGQGLE